jgi:2-dehydropantoate 2-reductase
MIVKKARKEQSSMEQIAVLGGGALGMLLASRLAASGQHVLLWTRTDVQALQINREGLKLEEPSGQALTVHVEALPFGKAATERMPVVLVALKQTGITDELLAALQHKVGDGATLVMFQNGIGHMERLMAALPGKTLLAAVTTEGALRLGTACVRHTGSGTTWIGAWPPERAQGAGSSLQQVKRMLEKAGFSTEMSNDIRESMLRKLLINAVINPLTALWRVPNGQLPKSAERLAVMQALFRETLDILRPLGLRTPSDEELWKTVLGVCAATAANQSSMLQDVLAGRQTEIDALNGAVCRMAESLGVKAPWNDSVTALVKAIFLPGVNS